MKQLIQLTLLLALVIGFLPSANAALLIEPLVGYNFSSKVELDPPGTSYSGGSGTAFGGRLGYQHLGLQLGLDYLNSTIDMDDKDFGKDVETSEWAAFIGFRFPVLVKVYAGYIFAATGETEYGTADVEMSKGSGFKLGAGWTLLPFVDLNLEYRSGTFDKIEFGGVEVSGASADYSSMLVSISLPFTL